MRYIVTEGWQASYADPIRLRPGDPVVLSGRRDLWEGHVWLWARAPDGREGWVPDDLIQNSRALRAYAATELTCAPGVRLVGGTADHGWIWCRDAAGAEGWVPARCLSVVAG